MKNRRAVLLLVLTYLVALPLFLNTTQAGLIGDPVLIAYFNTPLTLYQTQLNWNFGENQTSGGRYGAIGQNFTTETLGDTRWVTQVRFYGRVFGAGASGNVTARLYLQSTLEGNRSDSDLGLLAETPKYDATTFTPEGWHSLDFSVPYPVQDSTTYVLAFCAWDSNFAPEEKGVNIMGNNTNGYANHEFFRWYFGEWQNVTNWDTLFEVYASEWYPDVEGTLIDSYAYGNHNDNYNLSSVFPESESAVGQTFPSVEANITAAIFWMQRVGSPTGNLRAYLYNLTGTYGTDSRPFDEDVLVDYYPEENLEGERGINCIWGDGEGTEAVGQSFTANDTVRITKVVLYLRKFGSPTGNMRALLYNHSGTYGNSSVPSSGLLATSEKVNMNVLTTSYQLISFDFNSTEQYLMTNGTYYCIFVTPVDGTVNGANALIVGHEQPADSHSGNEFWMLDGSWKYVLLEEYDVIFYVYGISPTSVALASSNTINIAEIPTVWNYVTFNFTGVQRHEMLAQYYGIGVQVESGAFVDATNLIEVGTHEPTPTHDGNLFWHGSWSGESDADTIFYLYGLPEEPPEEPSNTSRWVAIVTPYAFSAVVIWSLAFTISIAAGFIVGLQSQEFTFEMAIAVMSGIGILLALFIILPILNAFQGL